MQRLKIDIDKMMMMSELFKKNCSDKCLAHRLDDLGMYTNKKMKSTQTDRLLFYLLILDDL